MTTNQTIDGVPRATLANFIEYSVPVSGNDEAWLREKAELRTLLDAPACKTCNGLGHVPDGEVTGSGGVEFENGPVECVKDCPACKPSAQPQGEPVAWLYTRPEQPEGAQRVPDVLLRERANPADVGDWKEQALFAEQPAPVAVQLLERFAEYAESGKVAEPSMAEDLRNYLNTK